MFPLLLPIYCFSHLNLFFIALSWHPSILFIELAGNIECSQASLSQLDVLALFSRTSFQEFSLIPTGKRDIHFKFCEHS